MTKYLNRLGDFTMPVDITIDRLIENDGVYQAYVDRQEDDLDGWVQEVIRRSIEKTIATAIEDGTPVDTGHARLEWTTEQWLRD